MKRILSISSITLFLGFIIACSSGTSSEDRDRAKVQNQQGHYQIVQPLPFFDFSLERDAVIQTLMARNEEVATHTIWRDHGTTVGDCPSIGYPIPYDTSLTNPCEIRPQA